ncbi:type II secretion system F family protein [Flavobacterium beibuense]|uniref:Type II secretory pathway, component PulF n=1 Tax=Flavobacterium beibuense TaxID=657326 RepID=A0A444W8S9_9FLAO|nr:type II secretion system F family protein [Flavobacterium beibuense]RYJ42036.1 Type II secretory pathway, component PulF [Flavobacterium beibuense]
MAFKLDNIQNTDSSKRPVSDIEKLLKKEIVLFGGGFSNKKKQDLYMELAVLLKAGITIKEALALLTDSYKKKADKELLENISAQVIEGKPFSEAVYTSKHFTEYEYFSLKIGEETGTTAQVCKELGAFFERKNEQKRIVISALTYPGIVLSTAVLVVIFMLNFVVPMFQDIFKQNKMELPMLTRIIIKMSSFTQSFGWLFFFLIIALIIGSRLLKDNYQYRKNIHYLLLKIPVFGSFISKVYLAQFTQAVTLLTSSKVPILNSIQMVKKMIRFVPLQDALEKVEAGIMKGHTLSESLKGNKLFDNRIISLVKVAEETNQTEYIFNQLNTQYSQEVNQQSKTMATVLEPLIIVFVGVLVAVLLVAMYLPMFQLSSAIG